MRISDWSSDVCSSDLGQLPQAAHTAKLLVSSLSARSGRSLSHWAPSRTRRKNARITAFVSKTFDCVPEVIWWPPLKSIFISTGRSEERRVGKEWGSTCRAGRSPYNENKKQIYN